MDSAAAGLIGMGCAAAGFAGAGVGIGYIFGKMIEVVARQPEAEARELVFAPHQVCDRALGDGAPFDDDADAPAQPIDVVEKMGAQKDADAIVGQLEKNVVDLAASARIEAVRRLVENQECRVGDEGAGQAEPLAHAAGERADRLAGTRRQSDSVQTAVQVGGIEPAAMEGAKE